MRILLAHNSYQIRGGEDAVFEDEAKLLTAHGHDVHLFQRHNDDVKAQPAWRTAVQAVWSTRSAAELQALIARIRPEVLHVHNTFPLLSPSILGTAASMGVGVVATLHNFRLACLEASFSRNGSTCTDCLGKAPWPGVAHGCYRGSRAQSAVLAASTVLHRAVGSWRKHVHRFIALNETARARFIQIGLPADRLVVKPNFAWPADDASDGGVLRSGGLFVGRLTREKGVHVLADALRQVPSLPFTVVGEGEAAAALAGTQARLTGALGMDAVRQHMRAAQFLVVPSVAAEQFPRVVAEGFASGLPIIGSAITPLDELAGERERGVLFPPGDARALASQLLWAQQHPDLVADMGLRAARYHASLLSPEATHRQLMAIYREAAALAGR